MQQWYSYTLFKVLCILMQVSVVLLSFSVTMASVSPPLFDAMESGGALMEVMRETAVSFSTI